MGKSVIIVALPADDDSTAKLSSEEKPHLTLLYLQDQNGDVSARIAEFIQHAAEVAFNHEFFLDVDRRGTLGDKDADVVFFKKNSYGAKAIKTFRHHLLGYESIRTAYDATEQFPEWIPHMTLGYPDKPAKESEHGLPFSVRFDRIAFWIDDYEGPIFRLESEEDSVDSVIDQPIDFLHSVGLKTAEDREDERSDFLSQVGVTDPYDDFLAHFGVKGMRWGFRRTQAQLDSGAPATAGKPSGAMPKGGVAVTGANGKALSGAAREAALRKALDDQVGATRTPSRVSADAATAAILNQQARELGIGSLSTKQLEQLNSRMKVEQQYHQSRLKNDDAFREYMRTPPSKKKQAIDFALAMGGDIIGAKAAGIAPKSTGGKIALGVLAAARARNQQQAAAAAAQQDRIAAERQRRAQEVEGARRAREIDEGIAGGSATRGSTSRSERRAAQQRRGDARRLRRSREAIGLNSAGLNPNDYRTI